MFGFTQAICQFSSDKMRPNIISSVRTIYFCKFQFNLLIFIVALPDFAKSLPYGGS